MRDASVEGWRLRSGKGRIVPRQSRSRRASQCPEGAKMQEGNHGRFVEASSESSSFRSGGRSCQQPDKYWRGLSWLLEHWPLWQPSPTPTEDLLLRESLGRGIDEHVPVERFKLDKELSLINLRTARKGAAAGPSGTTSDHLFPLLESERFAEFAQSLAGPRSGLLAWEELLAIDERGLLVWCCCGVVVKYFVS